MENKIARHIEVNGVTYDVPTIEGFDLVAKGESTIAQQLLNRYLLDEINYTISQLTTLRTKKQTTLAEKYSADARMLFFDNVDVSSVEYLNGFSSNGSVVFAKFGDLSKCINCSSAFRNNYAIRDIELNNTQNVTTFYQFCQNAYALKYISTIDTDNATNISYMLSRCSVSDVKLTSIEKVTTAVSFLANTTSVIRLEFDRWKQSNISLSTLSKLSAESIRYILDHACTIEEGATQRTLTLHATAYANFKASFESEEAFNEYIAEIKDTKDITIA